MKKRMVKKHAKQAVAEFSCKNYLDPFSNKRMQRAVFQYLFHYPEHPITKSFWKEYDRIEGHKKWS